MAGGGITIGGNNGTGGVVTGNIWVPTESGLQSSGFLDRLQQAMDNRAQYQGVLTGLAPALQASGVPVQQPRGFFDQLLGTLGLGGQQPQQPSSQLPTSSPTDRSGAPAPTMGGSAPPAQPTSAGGFMPMFGNAIASLESGGRYDAVGPDTGGNNRALGKYQVMASNVGPWTKELLGRELTPQQYLASPEAQGAVFQGKFGQYLSQTGNPQDAASMWFTGKPFAQGAGARDQLGTSGSSYVRRFMAALPGGGGGGAQDGGLPSQAMAYAPSGGGSDGPSLRPPTAAGSAGATPMPIATSSPGTRQMPQPPAPDVAGAQPEPAAQGPSDGANTAHVGQVLGPLMANPATRQVGQQMWQGMMQKGAGGNGLQLPAGMTPDALAQMISTPQTMQMGLGIWQKALYPGITSIEPNRAVFRGTTYLGQTPPEPAKMEVTRTGTDDYGAPTYSLLNPRTGALSPMQGQGSTPTPSGTPAAAGPGGAGTTNEAYLSSLPAPLGAQVKAIAEGRMKMPPVSSRSPIAARLPSMVLQYKPDYDQTSSDARFDTKKNFTDGPASVAINSGNTAIQHAADLSDAAEALGNSRFPLVNKIGQALGTEAGGNVAGKEFQGALNDFTDEVVRFYRNSGGTEADINAVKASLDPSQSPDQLRAGIQQQARLMAGKTNAYQNQWHVGMGPNEPDFPIFSKETQAALARIEARKPSTSSYPPRDAAGGAGAGQAPLPTASPAGSIPTITDPAQAQSLPPGTRFRTPDGQLRVRH